MASKKKKLDRHRTGTRPPARPSARRPSGPTEAIPHLELLTGLDEALSDPHPLAFLTLASGLVSAVDPRNDSPFGSEAGRTLPSLDELANAFLDAGFRQTDALLKVIEVLTGDEVLRARINRVVRERRHPIPGWLLRLDQIRPLRAVMTLEPLRDGDNVLVGVALPGGREFSIVVYIDHNMGTAVKDAFVIDQSLDDTVEAYGELSAGSDIRVVEIGLDDARAKIAQAIEIGAHTFPPFEAETWPAIRPLAEWIVSMMPEGGAEYSRPEWADEQLAELTDDFFASQHGNGLDDEDNRSLLESLLWFGTDYGPGDPLRWSPVAVEILLGDWIPRKIVAPVDYLAQAPALLRAFVRYCHAARHIPGVLTEETVAAVDKYEADYQSTIRAPRDQGPMAILERMGMIDSMLQNWGDPAVRAQHMIDSAALEVGGIDVLNTLDLAPLPDEAFNWVGIPDDVHARVAEISELIDGCCAALFDNEFRTAARRFLARVAAGDSDIFRRKSSTPMSAAAVCWVIGKVNNSFDLYNGPGVQVKQLMSHFGVTGSASQRAGVMLKAIGAHWNYGDQHLGDPTLLVSAKRTSLVETREEYRA